MNRRWLVQKTNPEYLAYLSRAASVSLPMAQILINRGMRTPEAAREFLAGGDLSDPFLIEGMPQAVEAIEEARRQSARVFVHGDYDADGLTATAIVVDVLMRLGLGVCYFIPNRFRNGYGFNEPAVELASGKGAALIITVDCGVASFDACARAKAAGLQVIICDHHEPAVGPGGEPLLPEARSVINPKITSPGLSNLSGAGIALKLAQALALKRPGVISHAEYLDLAALGTLADSVPLTGENRLIVKEGIPLIRQGARRGLKALGDVAGLGGRQLRAELLAFTIAPRINAAGRMADATEVVNLLLTGDEAEAEESALALHRLNADRQRTEEEVLGEALEILGREGMGPAIVLAEEGWHQGVLGIVAARLAERFQRPAFVLTVKDGIARGSARSVPPFDIVKGLGRCRESLISFGGHAQAAGLKLHESKIVVFRRLMEETASEALDDFAPTLAIDALVTLRDISRGFVEEMAVLEPFGCGNPEPVLGARGLEAVKPRVVGSNHLKMKLKDSARAVDSIGFDMGGFLETIEHSPFVDAAFTASINEWEGGRFLQLNLKGLRPA